jgi:tetratricopeptide (TPR) repeat protein
MTELREMDLMSKAKDYLSRNDLSNSLLVLNEIIAVNPSNSEAFFHLGNLFHMNGEIGKAIKSFNRVLELDPCHTDASISLSVLYNDIGRYEEGRKVFEKASERVKKKDNVIKLEDGHINRKFALKHYELADLYMTYERFDEALFEYNKAVGLNPDNFEIRIKIAKLYAKKGFMNKAFEELNKIKAENPHFAPNRIALGILHYGSGNIIEAQAEWERVLTFEPLNEEASMYLNLSKTATETTILTDTSI